MADKKPYTVRIDAELLKEVQDIAEQQGETVTAIFEDALTLFLQAPEGVGGVSVDSEQLGALKAKISRIESDLNKRIDQLQARLTENLREPKNQQKVKEQPEVKIPGKVKNRPYADNLITLKEGAELTGYTLSTFTRKKSNAGVVRADSYKGRALYDRDEVLQKVGIK